MLPLILKNKIKQQQQKIFWNNCQVNFGIGQIHFNPSNNLNQFN